MHLTRANILRSVVWIVPLVVLVAHAAHYLPFIADDALISLRYTQRLLAGAGLTWTEGPPVEGYSNLLWVLLCALPGMLGMDLLHGTWLLGIACMAVPLTLLSYPERGSNRGALLLACAGLYFVLSGPTAVWAVGGLEQALLAALLSLALPRAYAILEHPRDAGRTTLGVLLGLICWTRPDGPLFAVAVGTAVLLSGGSKHWRRLWPVFAIVAGFFLAQLLFRLGYYNDWVPNTARVKIAVSTVRVHQGWSYVAGGWHSLSPFSWLGLAALMYQLAVRELRVRGILLGCILLLWLAYLVFIGGDIFPAWRHYVPVIVVWLAACADSGRHLALRWQATPKPMHLMLFVSVALLLAHSTRQWSEPPNQRALRERWEWDGKAIGLSLKQAFAGQQPLVAVTAAGCIPYWSELPALDLMGLNDAYLPRHLPHDFGTGHIGHELGDGRYTLARRPDLIIFHMGGPPQFRAGEELARMPEFHALYGPVRFRPLGRADLQPTMYVRRDSVKLGLRSNTTLLEVPAVLIASQADAELVFSSNGRLVLPVHDQQSVTFRVVAEDFDADGVELRGHRSERSSVSVRREDTQLVIEIVNPDPQPALVESLLLRKRPRVESNVRDAPLAQSRINDQRLASLWACAGSATSDVSLPATAAM